MSANEFPDPDRRSRNLSFAVVVSLILVCGGLFVITQLSQDDEKVGESDYPVKKYADAAQVLEIEALNEWNEVEESSFTIHLPRRLKPINEMETTQIAVAGSGPNLLLGAMDQDAPVSGINVMVMMMPGTGDMTPAKYVVGVAKEMKAGGYSIKDKSSYDLGGERVGRLVYEATGASGQRLSGVQFVFARNGTIWAIVGTGMTSVFDDWLPVFEVIAREFRIR